MYQKMLNGLKRGFSKVKYMATVGGAVAVTTLAHAQEDPVTIPDVASMTAKIAAIGGIVGASAALGFGIWIYRKTKAKAGQALG